MEAPSLHTLNVSIKLDPRIQLLSLEEALSVTSRTPSLTHLAVAFDGLSDGCSYMPAIVLTLAWAFPTVTQFTADIPVCFLSVLCAHSSMFICPLNHMDCGFSLSERNPLLMDIPAIAFPRLKHLRCTDQTIGHDSRDLVALVSHREGIDCPLESITCYAGCLEPEDAAALQYRVVVYDWMDLDEDDAFDICM